MERRKCIGVFLGQSNLPFQADLLKHIRNHAFSVGSNVAVFSAMIYTGAYENFQEGESQNVSLANFDTMDAVIVVPDTLQASENDAKNVLEYVRNNFSGPKVVLDMEAEGYQQFFCDDKDSSAYIISHLIEQHNCQDIAYMTGIQGHPHSTMRLNGYYKALEDHNITIDESRVFFGDFWYNEGERVVEELIQSEKGLPEAIACANDAMAVSVYRALEKRGIKIPEDILVVGFDHSGNASGGDFPITSVMRNSGEIADLAMKYIFNEWGITNLPEINKEECLVINKSCGCKVEKKHEYQITNANTLDGFHSVYNFMLEDMISSDDLHACIWKIDWYASDVANFLNDYSKLRICLCDDWNSLRAQSHEGLFTEQMILALDKQNQQPGDKNGDYIKDIRFMANTVFERKDYFPGFGSTEVPPQIYYFNVLHFGKNCFGYIALSYGPESADHVYDDVYVMWIRKVNAALESLRRQYAVEELYIEAEERAITDTMTGLFNRNGYNKMLLEMIHDIKENEKFAFLFFDNNGLKFINDTYGHIAGDDVICQSTRIISKTYFPTARKELNFRIGGDEYVKLVLGDITGDMANDCINQIQKELNKINGDGSRPYPIYVAGGYQLYTSDTIVSPDDIMKSADEQMYVNKKIVKEITGFRPIRKK
ncbi:MAG: GGDEF domain-containing protein [Lachnospiraceae bacterium]|nr:GGDEF domain-containing protein [Lachnospiraceae bacterium]